MDTKKQKFLPVIIGSDENAYGMSRAFYDKYGIIPAVMCKEVYMATRYSKILEIHKFANLDEENIFIESIIKISEEKLKNYEKLILIPCADYYTDLAVKNKGIIEKYFCNKFIPYELMQKVGTKDKFYQVCKEHNLPYPKTAVCEKKDRLTVLNNLQFDFPVIVKPDNSNSSDYLHSEFDGKKKVFFVKTKEEYTDIINKMNTSHYNGNLIIQETIPGDDTLMRTLNCYSDNSGKVKLMCLGQPVIEEYAPLALGNYGAMMIDYNEVIFAQIKEFLESLKYVGFCNFDMKFDKKSGEYKLLDLNPRQGRSSFFMTAAGYNLAEFLVDSCVYGINSETVYANADMLWLTVPKSIIYKYVENKEILERAKKLIKEKKYSYTLLYKKDMNLKRFLRMKLYYHRHIANYKKYFFRKT